MADNGDLDAEMMHLHTIRMEKLEEGIRGFRVTEE